jgi:hypothetical protein
MNECLIYIMLTRSIQVFLSHLGFMRLEDQLHVGDVDEQRGIAFGMQKRKLVSALEESMTHMLPTNLHAWKVMGLPSILIRTSSRHPRNIFH